MNEETFWAMDSYEADLIARACDRQNNNYRELAKRELLKYIYTNYFSFLVKCAEQFEEKLNGPKLPGDYDDISRDFIVWVIEKDKLCGWKKASLKYSLSTMFHNYLRDIMRKYSLIEVEIDRKGKKVKFRSPIIERLFIPLPGGEEEEIVENPEIYNGIPRDSQEEEILDKLMLDKILQIRKKALLDLQTINKRDAEIVFMEMQKIPRSKIAETLGIKESGVNKVIERAFQKYAIIFHKLLKEEGIEPKISTEKLRKCLIDVTKE